MGPAWLLSVYNLVADFIIKVLTILYGMFDPEKTTFNEDIQGAVVQYVYLSTELIKYFLPGYFVKCLSEYFSFRSNLIVSFLGYLSIRLGSLFSIAMFTTIVSCFIKGARLLTGLSAF